MASQVSRCPDCGYLGPHRFVSKPEDVNGSSDDSPQVKKAGPIRRDDFNLDASDKGLSLRHGTERFTGLDSDAPIEFSHPARGSKDRREVPFNIRQSNEALDAALNISKTERKEFRKGRDKADELDYVDESDEKYDSEYDESEDERQGRVGTGKVSTAIVRTQTPSVNTPPQTQSPSDGSTSNIIQPAPATAIPPTTSSPQTGKTPPVITGPTITDITEHSATVTWNISEPCVGNLFYRIDGVPRIQRKIENLSSFHTENLTDLESGKTYLVTIESWNSDNIVSEKKEKSFQTLASAADTTPPQLVGQPDTAVSDATATITWKTGEKSTSVIKYGPSTGYEFTSSEDRELRTEHSIYISALSPSTTYHFQVISKDAAG
ncbi:MAG: hypothetical protein NT082_04350, partial [Chloroflexi bacterium]|nr:hypothetical protein [Chloroflexota bacterium]